MAKGHIKMLIKPLGHGKYVFVNKRASNLVTLLRTIPKGVNIHFKVLLVKSYFIPKDTFFGFFQRSHLATSLHPNPSLHLTPFTLFWNDIILFWAK